MIQRLRLIAVGCFLASLPLNASVTYEYTGNPFNIILGSPGVTTSNFISATLTFPSVLPGGLDYVDLKSTVEDWSITDGVHTLSASTVGTLVTFSFSTDGGGNIVSEWAMDISNGLMDLTSTNCLVQCSPTNDFVGVPAGVAAINGNPGTWVTQAVPEPSTFAVMISGGALLALLEARRRRRQHR